MDGLYPTAELADQRYLQQRLDTLFSGAHRADIKIGYAYGSDTSYASLGAAAGAIPVGCVTKLLTAMLAKQMELAGDIVYTDTLSHYLPSSEHLKESDDLTLKQLLEHTHGFDDSAISSVPLRSSGCIDDTRLLSQLLEAARIANPGKLYSYSNAGSWLMAAVLERVGCASFASLLEEYLLAPLDIEIQPQQSDQAGPEPMPICPAVGGALRLSVADLMALLRQYALKESTQWPSGAQTEDDIQPLPGWAPFERGVFQAWKYFGDGWFGHNSTLPGASLLVRINAKRATAVVIASRSHAASTIAAKLLARLLPEFASLRIPKRLDGRRADLAMQADVMGLYGNAACNMWVKRSGGALELCRYRCNPMGNRRKF